MAGASARVRKTGLALVEAPAASLPALSYLQPSHNQSRRLSASCRTGTSNTREPERSSCSSSLYEVLWIQTEARLVQSLLRGLWFQDEAQNIACWRWSWCWWSVQFGWQEATRQTCFLYGEFNSVVKGDWKCWSHFCCSWSRSCSCRYFGSWPRSTAV